MRYISLFSGIEAASVAWEPLGWEPLAFCEIDEFPSAVLAHRFPDVENLGDITKVDWKEVVARHGRPDIVVGGSPCQSFSVAGGRESLSGESRLMFEYVRALDEIRPRWFLWENVPGVLNTRDNAFAQLLGEVQKLGYGSLAWRVLDAQFFGVAQRRRRVFLVGRLGEGGSAAAVLFEPESLRGDNPSSREKRQTLAADARSGPAGADGRRGGAVAFAQNTRNEVRVQGDGTISGALAAQPGMKQQTYVAEARAYRTVPLPCPICGADAVVTVDDPQEPERFWHYSCGCSQLGCDNYGRIRRSFGSREDAIANWNGSVLLCSSIDYKQTPKVNDQLCHTLTHEGDGGIHSAVAYSDCLTPLDVQSKRVHGENSVSPTLQADSHEGQNIQPIVMASGHSHAEIGVGGVAPTLTAHNQKDAPVLVTGTTCSPRSAQPMATSSSSTTRACEGDGSCSTRDGSGPSDVTVIDRAAFNQGGGSLRAPHRADGRDGHARGEGSARGRVLASNGEEYVRALCARDFKGVGSQYVDDGKVIVQEDERDVRIQVQRGGGYVVRRLTPVETERLQGFPDGWTDLTGCDADAVAEKVAASLHYDEKKTAALLRKVRKWSQECPDGPRYKACGNSMAVPVMRWIGSRIQMVDEMEVRG